MTYICNQCRAEEEY